MCYGLSEVTLRLFRRFCFPQRWLLDSEAADETKQICRALFEYCLEYAMSWWTSFKMQNKVEAKNFKNIFLVIFLKRGIPKASDNEEIVFVFVSRTYIQGGLSRGGLMPAAAPRRRENVQRYVVLLLL